MHICKKATRYRFPGGFMDKPKTIFDDLSSLGIDVAAADAFYPYFIVFDFESFLRAVPDEAPTATTKKIQRHVPISVAVCSNVPEWETGKCFINQDLDALLTSMMTHITQISEKAKRITNEKFKWVFDRLDDLLKTYTETPAAPDQDEQIEADTDRDNFLSAEEAVKYGLADKIVKK